MKKITIVFLAVFLGTVAAFATTPKKMSPNEKLRTEIEKILEHATFPTEEEIATARVEFVVNDQGEIVVLRVESSNNALKDFIKKELNYKLVVAFAKENLSFKKYAIPVKVIKKN
ncbi:hypothetical protein [Flavicella sediminum]|uniref:hypothetical protein n=1 Tax=Flavicella sediminum TaxID=2585141 RepID=UPI0011201051|nr:hypothetical protein [Flavicella sediminum]